MTAQAENTANGVNSGALALVTGATSGVGLAVARRLAAAGHEVLMNYAHDEDRALTAEKELVEAGGTVRLMRADISTPLGVVRLLEEIRGTYGRLDVLVHSAGSFHPMSTAAPRVEGALRDGAVALGPLVYGAGRLGDLLTPGAGRLVAVSSAGARSVVPGYAGLGMAKAALESMVRYLAVELAGRGIAVNAVAAGKLAPDAPDRLPAEALARIVARTPAGRLTAADEVADVVALLCRPEAAALHGQVLTVDGGAGLL
ncbi:SDR family oxidoreductase [Streptomyces sp. NPDC050610]|uniref:SDR family oxidoreductase n=1 Tax=Streptomyces sp. NPDC050610 TaxID=3157097 RepID=UPI003422E4AE